MNWQKTNSFDERIDRLWQRVKEKYPITVERTNKYLNWRYAKHPMFNYDIFIAEKGQEIEGFIVIRIEKPEGFKIARIIDFISTDKAEKFILQKAVDYCKEQNIDLIDFFFSGNFHVNSLKETGFKEAIEEPLASIPMLFSPIDTKRKSIMFAFFSDVLDEQIGNKNNWYITKGDADQDRPN